MEYQEFINVVLANQTSRVRALNIPESSNPSSIPNVFGALIPEVIQIIESHFEELSEGKPKIYLFGLQNVGVTIKSNLPIHAGRIITKRAANNHLCCVLYYLPVNGEEELNADAKWGGYKSVVLDFTYGTVMDRNQYMSFAMKTNSHGKIYGRLNAEKLASAWKAYQKRLATSHCI